MTDRQTDRIVAAYNALRRSQLAGNLTEHWIVDEKTLTGNVEHFIGHRSTANELICSLPLLVRVSWAIRRQDDSVTCKQTEIPLNIHS